MRYFEAEKKQQEKNRKRLQCYMEKISEVKKRKGKGGRKQW